MTKPAVQTTEILSNLIHFCSQTHEALIDKNGK